jgi:hypothetical protein
MQDRTGYFWERIAWLRVMCKLEVTAERILGVGVHCFQDACSGCFLWVRGIKMSEKLSISEIVEAGGIIAHAVFEAGNDVVAGDVTMLSLACGGLVLGEGRQERRVEVVEPLSCQNRVGVLSILKRILRSRTSKHWAAAS